MIEWVKKAQRDELTQEFCRRLEALAAANPKSCPLALTGGGSATVFYDAWTAQAAPAGNLEFYWSDERLVPLDNTDSNFKLALDHWLRPSHVPPERIHAAPVGLGGEGCAAAYADLIRQQVVDGGGVPRFPLIILGLGEDGHTGSLFPGHDPYQDESRLVRAVEGTEAHPHARITFTPRLINAAAEVWFLITGAKKAWAAQQLATRNQPVEQVPALAVDPAQTRITIFQEEA